MDTITALETAIARTGDVASQEPGGRGREGTQTKLAELLTAYFKDHPDPRLKGRVVTQAHVATWVMRDRVAGDMCGGIQAVTGVAREWLRPDLFYDALPFAEGDALPLADEACVLHVKHPTESKEGTQ